MSGKTSSLRSNEDRERLLRKLLMRPIRAILAWWFVSLVMFVSLYPAQYRINFNIVFVIMLTSGIIVSAAYSRSTKVRGRQIEFASDAKPKLLLIAASSILMISAGLARGQALGFNTESVVDSLGNLGAAYSNRKIIQNSDDQGSTATLLVSGLFFLFPFAVPLAIMQWKAIPTWLRVLVIGGVISYGGYFLASGTMKGFSDLALLLAIGLIVRSSRARLTKQPGSAVTRHRRWTFAAVATLASFLWIVAAAMASRLDGRPSMLPVFQQTGLLGRTLGPYWSPAGEAMLSYFAKGYVGFGIALDYPSPYGLYGGFRGVSNLLSRYFGLEDSYKHALPFVAEGSTGYSATVNWWTVFPWLASDLGWVGAVLLVGLVAILAGRLWVNILYQEDPLSIGLFFFVLTFLVYVPANNQVFIGSESTLGSLSLLLAYTVRGFMRANAAVHSTPRTKVRNAKGSPITNVSRAVGRPVGQ